MAVDAPLEAARRSGLVPSGEPLVVMLSGGADSTCLLDVALRLGAEVRALHVDHGLRPDSEEDARHCGELCERLGVPLDVERVRLPGTGNVQAQAREARYAVAERLGSELGADHAAAHTLSDQAETVVYRLATSPGPRALLGMAPRRGRLVRPLLEVPGSATRTWCRENGLDWREDPSNADPRYARSRVRAEVMPVLLDLSPAAERTIARTAQLLREDADVLEAAAAEALGGPGVAAVSAAELAAQPRALRRLALRRLAAEASPGAVALSDEHAERVLALAAGRAGSASLHVGGGLRALVEYGMVRFSAAAASPLASEPVVLPVPGRVAFGEWEVEARREPDSPGAAPHESLLDAGALGSAVTVRARREGDRVRPAGVGGSKSLQDLFTDLKIPRELRSTLPVVEVDGEIAWVAGVAVGERFRARSSTGAVAIAARRRPVDSRG
ncbi:MAG: tRNA lysidine(34) synthetase TilS [Thermoleophilaceae bacterium]